MPARRVQQFVVCVALAIGGHAFSVVAERHAVDLGTTQAAAHPRWEKAGSLPTVHGRSLYWFGNFSVGDAPSLKLLIDTGSTDLIVNSGEYKPSMYEKPYGRGNFSTGYEGVNRAGFGFETIRGTVQRDIVCAGGLTVTDQAVGEAKEWKYYAVPQLPFADPGQGIIGFQNSASSGFHPRAPSWFESLCDNNLLPERRFGLAFGTNGEGSVEIGQLNHDLIQGGLVSLPDLGGYTVRGDVTVDGKVVMENQTLIMDVGTDNIQSPIQSARHIFDILGYKGFLVEASGNTAPPFAHGKPQKILKAFFPCNKPPMLGFSFPSQADLKAGENATNFNVSPLVWDVFDHGNNNCTSILGGTNALKNAWLLGQPFFTNHYIDFDIAAKTLNFGDLK